MGNGGHLIKYYKMKGRGNMSKKSYSPITVNFPSGKDVFLDDEIQKIKHRQNLVLSSQSIHHETNDEGDNSAHSQDYEESSNTEEQSYLLKGAPTVKEVKKYGLNYYSLWSNRSKWIIRKTQTVQHINRDTFNYIYSYDIDFDYVMQFSGKPHGKQEDVWLPLEPLKKGEILSIGITGEWQGKIGLVTRRENTRIALYILVGYLLHSGFEFECIKQEDINLLYNLLLNNKEHEIIKNGLQIDIPFDSDRGGKLRNALIDKHKEQKKGSGSNCNKPLSECSSIVACIDNNDDFCERVMNFISCYPLTICLPQDDKSPRLHLDVDICNSQNLTLRSRIRRFFDNGFRMPSLYIPLNSVGLKKIGATCKVLAPDEARIIQQVFSSDEDFRFKKSSSQASIHFYSPSDVYQKGKSSFNIGNRTPSGGEEFMKITINTRRGYFAFPSLMISAGCFFITSLILLFLSNLRKSGSDLHLGELVSTGSIIITMIASVPPLTSGLWLLRGEHEINSISLGIPRLFLFVNTAATFVFALSIIGRFFICKSHAPNQSINNFTEWGTIWLSLFKDNQINVLYWAQYLCLIYFVWMIVRTTIHSSISPTLFQSFNSKICQFLRLSDFNLTRSLANPDFSWGGFGGGGLGWCVCGVGWGTFAFGCGFQW
ncbi:hypothetical protein, partial [Corynebacterium felinum]